MELKEGDLPVKTKERKIERFSIDGLLLEIGLEKGEISKEIIERMELLDELTDFIGDELKAIELSQTVFDFYKGTDNPFSDAEERTVKIGTLFSDIGKTGPARANKRQQRLIVEMFAVEGVRNTKMSVRGFFEYYFPEDTEVRIKIFEELGLNSSMPIRDFWNLHAVWTLEIIKGDGVPPEAVAAAAVHQILEGINPDDIIGIDGRFTRYFGANASFDRTEKLLILLDKYGAFRRRLGKSHQETIARVGEMVAQNERFINDEEFAVLLKNIEKALANS